MYILRALNNFIFILTGIVFLSCMPNRVIELNDSNFYLSTDYCNYQEKLTQRTLNQLAKFKVIDSKKEKFHIKVVFEGKTGSSICIAKCNGGFQDPSFIAFFDKPKLKIILDKYNIELYYNEYRRFCEINEIEAEKAKQIWNYILSFLSKELENKKYKINF